MRAIAVTPFVRTPLVRTPLVRTPLVRTPLVRTPLVRTPLARTLTRVIAPAAIFLLAAVSSATAAPSKATLKGQFKFVSDAPVEKIVGTCDAVQGEIETDLDALEKTKGRIALRVDCLKTGNTQRDEHMQGEMWLDAAQHPEIVFTIDAVKVLKSKKGEVSSASLEATGRFALHGQTTTLVTPVEVKWKGNKLKAQVNFSIKLADYGVKGKDGVVGSKVGETIKISGSLKGVAN